MRVGPKPGPRGLKPAIFFPADAPLKGRSSPLVYTFLRPSANPEAAIEDRFLSMAAVKAATPKLKVGVRAVGVFSETELQESHGAYGVGILRLRRNFASLRSCSAQDDSADAMVPRHYLGALY